MPISHEGVSAIRQSHIMGAKKICKKFARKQWAVNSVETLIRERSIQPVRQLVHCTT